MHLLLDTHQSEVFGSESGSFTIAFNEAGDSFDVASQGLRLVPGQKTNIYVSVTKFDTKKEIREGRTDFFLKK